MYRQNIDLMSPHLMDHAASKMDAVLGIFPLRKGMGAFQSNIIQSEEFQIKLQDHLLSYLYCLILYLHSLEIL